MNPNLKKIYYFFLWRGGGGGGGFSFSDFFLQKIQI